MDKETFVRAPFRRWGSLEATVSPLTRLAPERHPDSLEIVGIREESENMGALSYILPLPREHPGDRPVLYLNCAATPRPGTGSPEVHGMEQATLASLALGRPQ